MEMGNFVVTSVCVVRTDFFTDVANSVAIVTASSVENESCVLSGLEVGAFGGGTFEDEDDEAVGFICFFVQDSEWQV